MVGLGRFDIAFHKVVAEKMKLPDRFSICPPSSGIGKLTVEAGAPTKSDISGLIKTTPLIVNKPVSNQPFFSDNDLSQEYFIDVSSIRVAGEAVDVKESACYNAETVKRTGAGQEVPAIDLVLPGKDVYWRISGANAMVEVDRKTMCLAFVDASQLRFTSLLLVHNKTCSRIWFHFTFRFK
ncbi:hypothetical protein SASPL_148484 [Salvia splendens]|uniref:Xylanase inhibitor C-terminal domain-containing protein n=1 Tax=Salvia splendens TaxID=180675 RepID=A0A8X8WAC7_SALSN|nr:hypothetical protein SASPL_148484 [Salvia splendens]